MRAGDTCRPADNTVDKFVHLWVIISDPEQDSNDEGDLIPNDPMRPDVLERIRKRSSFSTKMEPDLWDIFDRQGLV